MWFEFVVVVSWFYVFLVFFGKVLFSYKICWLVIDGLDIVDI